jgi:hypothetical protein
MEKHIYDKTDKGREEIATRKYHLSSKLRTLLLMMDGNRTVEVLSRNFAQMGLTIGQIDELLQDEYIFLAKAGVPDTPTEQEAPKGHGPSARLRQVARREASSNSSSHDEAVQAAASNTVAGSGAPAAAPSQAAPSAPALAGMSDPERFVALQEFYTQTIKSTLGFRGMMLQLKVEKCANIAEFGQLRDVYMEALLKAKGREMTLSLIGRLDQLLGIDHLERNLP